MDASLWVHKNILKLSKAYDVNFQGCEKEALSLFMKIDSRRQELREAAILKTCTTPKREQGSFEV